MNKLKRFFEPILEEPFHFWTTFFIQVVLSLFIIFNVFFIREIVGILENGKNSDILKNYLLVFVIINITYFILVYIFRHWGWAQTYFHHFKMIHKDYLKKFNNLDNTYVESIGTGKSLSIIIKGLSTWTDFIIAAIQIPTNLIISLIATFVILSEIGLLYLLLFLLIFFILHIIAYFLNIKAIEWRNKRISTENEYDRQLTKMIMSKFEILQNNKIDREIKVLDKYADEATTYNKNFNNYIYLMFSLPDIFIFIIILSIFYFMLKVQFSYEFLVSSFMIIGMLRGNISESIRFFKDFTKSFGIIERMWSLIDNGPEIKGLNTGKDFLYKTGEIHIKNLDFSYAENKVFENFSIDFIGGKKIALVGISGSGKTTLVKLISGFLSKNSGKIIIDGQSLDEINLNSYYKNIGYLTQDPSVFDGTILENLTYGINDSPPVRGELEGGFELKLDQAIKDSKCEFIYDFKDGLETEIGERGVRLSGGQKQRLAIAKLFIKNPQIIILDEPTSALDSFSEEVIRVSFEKLFAGKTVFIIAHRLQTVKTADDIIVFENGKVIERGNHLSLIEKNGYYKKMLDLQSGF